MKIRSSWGRGIWIACLLCAAAGAKAGGTIRIGLIAPTATPEPSHLADEGGLGVASVPGEFLTFSDKNLQLQPWLATSWKPNATATV